MSTPAPDVDASTAAWRARPADQQAREDARYRLHELVLHVAVAVFGGVRYDDLVPGYRTLTRPRIEPGTARVRAAVWLQRFAVGLLDEAAGDARAGGQSWADIGKALGLDDADGRHDVGERAYLQVCGVPDETDRWGRWGDEPRAYWPCRSCGQTITDHGPWDPHPDDVERGHAPGCARHAADVAAYQAARDDA